MLRSTVLYQNSTVVLANTRLRTPGLYFSEEHNFLHLQGISTMEMEAGLHGFSHLHLLQGLNPLACSSSISTNDFVVSILFLVDSEDFFLMVYVAYY